jgi:hypothetical protein
VELVERAGLFSVMWERLEGVGFDGESIEMVDTSEYVRFHKSHDSIAIVM